MSEIDIDELEPRDGETKRRMTTIQATLSDENGTEWNTSPTKRTRYFEVIEGGNKAIETRSQKQRVEDGDIARSRKDYAPSQETAMREVEKAVKKRIGEITNQELVAAYNSGIGVGLEQCPDPENDTIIEIIARFLKTTILSTANTEKTEKGVMIS